MARNLIAGTGVAVHPPEDNALLPAIRLVSAPLAVVALGTCVSVRLLAQAPAPQASKLTPEVVSVALQTATVDAPAATLTYANRPILRLRATVLLRTPEERVAAATAVLNQAAQEVPAARVVISPFQDARLISLDTRPVFAILPQDVDLLTGETPDSVANAAAARLQVAFDEAAEVRSGATLLRSTGLAAVATLVFVGVLWLIRRLYRRAAAALSERAEQSVQRLAGGQEILRIGRTSTLIRRVLALVTIVLSLLLTNAWLTYVLQRFPYTRPWGETLRASLLQGILTGAALVMESLPDLVVVLAIVLITRMVVRLANMMFDALEEGRLTVAGIYPDTVRPTRRIVVALLWLFAIVLSYGYLPGSDTEVFKGVSVFVGIMVSLGSTGLMNQAMSGLTLTYSRAVRLGDFVRVGDVEGTITHLGTLAAKIMTPRREEITIPNAVMIASSTTNFSRLAASDGVLLATTVTIGYDTPWRQVKALLLLAAERTNGVRREPGPVVRQTALRDFYVEYTLLVCLDQPHLRLMVLDELHANIQDAFNEYGVQIMSPNYEADPAAPKTVARTRWFAAPARVDTIDAAARFAEPLPQPTSSAEPTLKS